MSASQKKYNTFRLTHPEFVYDSYHYDVQSDGLHISFRFLLGERFAFEPSAFIPARPFLHFDLPVERLDSLIFNIGMIELVSYWKCFCPPTVIVKCGSLDTDQIAFWKKIYFMGLGEFFYTNQIRATSEDFMKIRVQRESKGQAVSATSEPNISVEVFSYTSEDVFSDTYLVPIGGGKDSCVTLSLLKEKHRTIPLIMNPRGATVSTIEVSGFSLDDALVIHRRLDPLMLELNAKGCLNGHTPFSALLGFYTLLGAALTGVPNIALSNERSASQPTVIGTHVNHQYSKSLEFENDFRTYISRHLSPWFNYFSFLRPISELSIALLFSHQCVGYHSVFRSCNVGSKQDIWCGHCAKCLFVYIILSPFMQEAELVAIFGHNLLDDASLQTEFDQLLGRSGTKPFECVGTIEEVRAALSLLKGRLTKESSESLLLKDFKAESIDWTLFQPLKKQHNLNPDEYRILESKLSEVAKEIMKN